MNYLKKYHPAEITIFVLLLFSVLALIFLSKELFVIGFLVSPFVGLAFGGD